MFKITISRFWNFPAFLVFCYVLESLCYALAMHRTYDVSVIKIRRIVKMSYTKLSFIIKAPIKNTTWSALCSPACFVGVCVKIKGLPQPTEQQSSSPSPNKNIDKNLTILQVHSNFHDMSHAKMTQNRAFNWNFSSYSLILTVIQP